MDFTITEDGAPQTIKIFDYQSLPTTAAPPVAEPTQSDKIKIYGRCVEGKETILSGETRAKMCL